MASTHRLSVFVSLCCCLLSAQAQQRGYLPPVQDTCNPNTRTSIFNNYQTSTVIQPFTVAQTQTRVAQAVATATMAITTTMQRVQQSQVVIPVFSTVQQTQFVTRTQVQNVPFQPAPVTRFVTSTVVSVQTRVNTVYVTRRQTSVRPVFITRTIFNTVVQTQFNTQTRFENRQSRQPDVTRFVTQTQFVTRTQQVPTSPVTRTVQSQVVQTSQVVQFETPRAFTRTEIVRREVVSTQFQQAVNTQLVTRTVEVTQTQTVPAFTTQVQRITSTIFRNQVVVRTRFVDRVVTSTQVIPQVVTSTSVYNQVNNRVVTVTSRVQGQQAVQTVRGRDDVREQVVTSYVNQLSTVYNNVAAQPQTIVRTVTRPCQQQERGGYKYNTPSTPFNYSG